MSKINYSQSWEDPLILQRALSINTNDMVLSITSGGDNSIYLTSFCPKEIVTVDININQSNLFELKLAAFKTLKYEDLLVFLGATKNELVRPTSLLPFVKKEIKSQIYDWCLDYKKHIDRGLINVGKFESFVNSFRQYFLPLIHSKKTIRQFVSLKSVEEQISFYKGRWCTYRWDFFFRLISNRFIMKRFIRQKEAFVDLDRKSLALVYLERLNNKIRTSLIKDNSYFLYSLTGQYGDILPTYLSKQNYNLVKSNNATKIFVVTDNILSYLKNCPDNYFTKFNLSDIFDFCSDEIFRKIFNEIIRVSKPGAKLAYWDNLLKRELPLEFKTQITRNDKESDFLFLSDRTFFYDRFNVCEIIK